MLGTTRAISWAHPCWSHSQPQIGPQLGRPPGGHARLNLGPCYAQSRARALAQSWAHSWTHAAPKVVAEDRASKPFRAMWNQPGKRGPGRRGAAGGAQALAVAEEVGEAEIDDLNALVLVLAGPPRLSTAQVVSAQISPVRCSSEQVGSARIGLGPKTSAQALQLSPRGLLMGHSFQGEQLER